MSRSTILDGLRVLDLDSFIFLDEPAVNRAADRLADRFDTAICDWAGDAPGFLDAAATALRKAIGTGQGEAGEEPPDAGAASASGDAAIPISAFDFGAGGSSWAGDGHAEWGGGKRDKARHDDSDKCGRTDKEKAEKNKGKKDKDKDKDKHDDDGDAVLSEYHAGSHDGDAGYDILIEFRGPWVAELQQAFLLAADYFTGTATSAAVITDDIGGGGTYEGRVIDDLFVTAELKQIDDVGGILAQAGPQAAWSDTSLSAAGIMEFDLADVGNTNDRGLWQAIVTHEMMHVLGFGTLWEFGRDLLDDAGQYVGPAGVAAYGGPVPVEQRNGEPGAHWDEAILDNELMTGIIDDDGDPATTDDNVLSEVSIMTLADLGYAVEYQDYPYDDPLIA